jgi:hypothetical protein
MSESRSRFVRREVEAFSLSFLDVISCGFGAIILLIVMTKTGDMRALEEAKEQLNGVVAQLQQELFKIRGESDVLNRELTSKTDELTTQQQKLDALRSQLDQLKGRYASATKDTKVADILEGRLATAKQSLTEEMQRLVGASFHRRPDEPIGGIPVDSEYVIFVIDTSGSMQNFNWQLMLRTLNEVLDIYPHVKGMQVMNDEGYYMFSHYAGEWMDDTPARRKAIVERARNWTPFSNSSPVEGIQAAISNFWSPDKKISVYVFGDDFTGGSIQRVVDMMDKLNGLDNEGHKRVRIHAVGFPVPHLGDAAVDRMNVRYATLMRIICERNDGAFVGLNGR